MSFSLEGYNDIWMVRKQADGYDKKRVILTVCLFFNHNNVRISLLDRKFLGRSTALNHFV